MPRLVASETESAKTYRVSIAVAAMAGLEAYKGQESEMLTLPEITRCTTVSKSTVFQIHALQHLGYIQKDVDSGRYFLNLKILEFAKYFRRANSF